MGKFVLLSPDELRYIFGVNQYLIYKSVSVRACGTIILMPFDKAEYIVNSFKGTEEVKQLISADVREIKTRSLRLKADPKLVSTMKMENPLAQVRFNYILEALKNNLILDKIDEFCKRMNYRMLCEVEVPKKNCIYPNMDIGISASGKIENGATPYETILNETLEEIAIDLNTIAPLEIQLQRRNELNINLPLAFLLMKTLCYIIIM